MANERVERLLLRFEVSRADLQNAKKQLGEATRELDGLKKQETAFSTEADKAVKALQRQEIAALKAKKALKDTTAETKDLTKATKDAASASDGLGKSQSRGGRSGNAIQRFGRDVRALPAVEIPGTGISTDVVGKIVGTVGAFGPVGLAAAAAAGALTIAIGQQFEATRRLTEAAKEQIAVQEGAQRVILTSTTEEIQAAKDKALADRNLTYQLLQQRAAALDAAKASTGFSSEMDRLATDAGKAYSAVKSQQDAFDALVKQYTAIDTAVMEYDAALAANVATNRDAIAAQEEMNRRLQDYVDTFARTQIDVTIRAADLTSETARKRLEAIQNEIAAVETFNGVTTLSDELQTELAARVEKLKIEANSLNGALAGIDFRTKRDETIAAAQKYNDDIAKIEEAKLKERLSLTEKYNDAVVQIAERAAEAAESALAKLEQTRASLALELGRAGLDAERQAQYDQIDAQIDFQREEAKSAREHANELKRIRQRANFDEATAVGERDVLAFVQAEQQKQQELAAANDQYLEQQNERRIAFGNETADQRRQFDRERQERLIKYSRDLFDAQTQYNQEIALANQKRAQDLARAQLANQQDQQQLTQKFAQERKLRNDAMVRELSLINAGYDQRARLIALKEKQLYEQSQRILGLQAASGIPGPASSSSAGPSFTNRNLPGFDSGGVITRTGAAIVHRGEIVVQPKRGQSAGVTNNIIGTSLEGTLKKIEQALIQAGYQ